MTRVSIPFGNKSVAAYWWLKRQEIYFLAGRSSDLDSTYKSMEFELDDERVAVELALRFG